MEKPEVIFWFSFMFCSMSLTLYEDVIVCTNDYTGNNMMLHLFYFCVIVICAVTQAICNYRRATMPMFLNTTVLARELDTVQRMSADRLMMGWFSGVDEQVLKLLEAYPQLRSTHATFSQARQHISPRQLTSESWEEMKRAASGLAEAARELGNINIFVCERPTKYSSTCGHALMPSGDCTLDWHTDK